MADLSTSTPGSLTGHSLMLSTSEHSPMPQHVSNADHDNPHLAVYDAGAPMESQTSPVFGRNDQVLSRMG